MSSRGEIVSLLCCWIGLRTHPGIQPPCMLFSSYHVEHTPSILRSSKAFNTVKSQLFQQWSPFQCEKTILCRNLLEAMDETSPSPHLLCPTESSRCEDQSPCLPCDITPTINHYRPSNATPRLSWRSKSPLFFGSRYSKVNQFRRSSPNIIHGAPIR